MERLKLFMNRYGLVISYIIAFGIFFLLASCSTTRTSTNTEQIRTVYRTDTLKTVVYHSDTLRQCDSVYTFIKGDTLISKEKTIIYNNRIEYRDTSKAKVDTLYQTKTVEVEKVKEPSSWTKFLLTLKGIVIGIGAFGVVLLTLWGINKFKKK